MGYEHERLAHAPLLVEDVHALLGEGGVSYREQQFRALMMEPAGYLSIPDEDQAGLAARIAAAMDVTT